MWFNPKTGSWQFGDEPSWTADYVEKARAEQEERDRLEAEQDARRAEAEARRAADIANGRLPGDMVDTTLTTGERFAQGVEGSFVGDYGRYLGRLGNAAYRASEKSGGFAGPLAVGQEFALQEQAVPPEEKGILGRAQDAMAGEDPFLTEYEKISKASRAREADATRQTELAGGGGFMGDVAQFGGQMLGDLPVYAAIPEVGAEALGLRLGGGRAAQLAAETAMNLPTDVASGLALEKLRGRDDSLGAEIAGAVGGRALLGGAGKLIGKGLEARQLDQLAPDLDAAGRKEFEQGMGRVRQEFGQAGMDQGKIGYVTGNEEARKAIAASKIVRIAALTGKDPLDVAKNLRVKGFIDEDTMLEAIAEQAKLEPEVVRAKLGEGDVPKGATVGQNISLGPQADFSTSVHEIMHAVQKNLKPEDLGRLERWAGAEGGNWTDAAMEKVAEGFERFVAEGQAPKSKLGEIFQNMSKWVNEAYAGKELPGEQNLGEARGAFESMIGAKAPGGEIGTGAAARALDTEEPLFQKEKAPVAVRTLEDLDRNVPVERRTFEPQKTREQRIADASSFDQKKSSFGDAPPVLDNAEINDAIDTARMMMPGIDAQILTAAKGADQKNQLIVWKNVGGKAVPHINSDILKEALSQPASMRYWYEMWGNEVGPKLELDEDLKNIFDQLLAATSQNTPVTPNTYRAISTLSEFLRKVPAATDLIDKTLPRAAFAGELHGGTRLKESSFGRSAAYMTGRSDIVPHTTNDTVISNIFGIDDGKVQGSALYEFLHNVEFELAAKMNAKLPEGAPPIEPWQVQAMLWGRNAQDPIGYSQAMEKAFNLIEAEGIKLPVRENGQRYLDMDSLLDPRITKALSRTAEGFEKAKILTFEVPTLKTKSGARLAELRKEAEALGIERVEEETDALVSRAHRDLASRKSVGLYPTTKPSELKLFERLYMEIAEESPSNVAITRIEGFLPDSYGTYEGDVNRNLRAPLPEMDPVRTRAFLAILGRAYKQAGVAASRFLTPADVAEADTFRIFIPNKFLGAREVAKISKDLGLNVSSRQAANGTAIDIIPRMEGSGDSFRQYPVDGNKVAAVAVAYGGDHLPKKFDSTYVDESEYTKAIRDLRKVRNGATDAGAGKKAGAGVGNRRGRVDRLDGVIREIELAGKAYDDDVAAAIPKLEKLIERAKKQQQRTAGPAAAAPEAPAVKAEAPAAGEQVLFQTGKAELEKEGQNRLFEGAPVEKPQRKPKAPAAAAPPVEAKPEAPPVKTRPVAPEKWMEDEDPGYPKAVEKIYAAAAAKEGPGKNGVIANSEAAAALGVGIKTARGILGKMEAEGLLVPMKGGARRLARPAKEILGSRERFLKEAKAFDSDVKKEETLARRATEEEWQKRTLEGKAPPPKKPTDPAATAGGVPDPNEGFIEPAESVSVGLRAIEDGERPPSGRKSGAMSWVRNQLTPIRHRLAAGYLGKEGQRWGVMEEATNEAQDRFLAAAAEPLARLNAHLTRWGDGAKGSLKDSAKEALAGKGYSAKGKAFLNEIRDYMIAKTLKDEEYLSSGKISDEAKNFGEDLLAVSRDFGQRMEELQIGVRGEESVRAFKMREDWALPLLFPKDADKGYSIADTGRAGAYGGSVFRERGTDIKQVWAMHKDPKKGESEALPDGDEFYTRMREYFEKAARVSAEAENFGYARKNGQLWMEDSLDGMMKHLQEAQGADDAKKRYVDEVIAKAYGKRQYDTMDQYIAMIGTAEASSKLFPFSALPQFVQGSHIMAKTGFSKALLDGMSNVFTDDMRAAIAKSGGTTDSLMQSLPKSFRDSPVAMKVLGDLSRKVALMPNRKADQMMRHVAGSTGKMWAERLALDVVGKGPKAKVAEIELKRLGIDPGKVRDQGGLLNEKQVDQAITRFIRRTQTTSGALEQVGGLAGSPSKQVLFQFLGFMVKNAFLIGDEVAGGIGRAWKAGDHTGAMNRLAAYAVGSAALGAGSVAVRDLLTSKKYKEGQGPLSAENLTRYASQALAIDTFGRMLESYDREDKLGMIPLGPAVRDTFNIAESLFDAGWLAKNKVTGEKWLESEDKRPLSERARDLVREKREAGEPISMKEAISTIRRKEETTDLERRFKIQSFKDKAISSVPASRMFTQGYSKLKGRDYREDRVRRVKLYAKPRSETPSWREEQKRKAREES